MLLSSFISYLTGFTLLPAVSQINTSPSNSENPFKILCYGEKSQKSLSINKEI